MTITESNVPGKMAYRKVFEISVGDGNSEILKSPPVPCTIAIIPAGNTGNVFSSCSSNAEIDGETANWLEWAPGAVAIDTSDVLLGPVSALKFTATGGTVIFEVVA